MHTLRMRDAKCAWQVQLKYKLVSSALTLHCIDKCWRWHGSSVAHLHASDSQLDGTPQGEVAEKGMELKGDAIAKKQGSKAWHT